ncbi:hypothetical protein C7S18_11915 [Ahniella affigens]|uniref:HEAT repeat domain-containing protein n=1 Tax=Ahniella affigens TaxID=2021234 RepID=A0A2P1PSN1_9GAMM|nr:HEAT repeat domain-containing protein [Ahniella affigens]AVP97857.1 hypothetical protein C7S18_11915 [Ahniella affigens]
MNKRSLHILFTAGMAIAAASTFGAAPPTNGWAQWQTQRATGAPSYCCMEWNHGRQDADAAYCDLNQAQHSINSIKSDPDQTMQVFAHFESGKLTEVRTLSTSCEVRHRDQAVDLGTLSTADSVGLLTQTPSAAMDKRHDHSMLMLSVALHPGALAQNWLETQFRSDDRERRQDALFWLGQVRAEASRPILKQALTQDADERMRRHACFVVAESGLPERFDWLRDAAEHDSERSVRHDAWFWFAQAKPANAQAVLTTALQQAKDARTRDHLVFVLSQLPAPQGTDALIALLTDPNVGKETRKQALFWLGQSEDPRALAALDRFL